MKKEIIFVMAMSLVSSLALAANSNTSNPKGSYDSTPPATGDNGYGAYNGSTGEKTPAAGAGVSGSASTSGSTSTERDPAAAAASANGSYEGTASSSGAGESGDAATASVQGSMDTFNKLDKNKDGMLSKAEARKDKTIWKNFKKIDTDKDGKISQSEYEAFIGGAAGAGTTGDSSAAPGLKTDPGAGSSNHGVADTRAGTSGGAKTPEGNNIR